MLSKRNVKAERIILTECKQRYEMNRILKILGNGRKDAQNEGEVKEQVR